MRPFRYEAPQSIEEALSLFAGNGEETRALAGGTDLIVQMRAGVRHPGCVIDLKRIPELMRVTQNGAGLVLGASAPAAAIREQPGLEYVFPGLLEAIALIGSDQIQGRASVGGNLCNASPAADTVPPLIALGAEGVVAGPGGTRTIPVEEFITGPGETVLGPREFLVEIRVPAPAPRSADAYLRLTPRTEMDIAVVGAAVSVRLDEAGRCEAARVCLGAVAPTPIRVPEAAAALVGSRLEDEALERAAQAARAASRPIDDQRATAAYRRQVVGVLVRRAARNAAERARNAGDGSHRRGR